MKVPSSSNMFQISQFGYGVFVLVVYFFVLGVYKASSSKQLCPDFKENGTYCIRSFEKSQIKSAADHHTIPSVDGNISDRHECFCTYDISSLTGMCTLIIEIRNTQQCIHIGPGEVSFSFTRSTNYTLPDLSSGFSGCTINITQQNINDCKEMPLMECVAQRTLISMRNQSITSQTPYSVRECDSEDIGQTYTNNDLTSVDELIRKCKGKEETLKNVKELHSIKNTFYNVTKQGPQKVTLDSLKGSVTSHKKNNLLIFRMSLPSTNNVELEKMDDIWLEIPTDALSDAMGDTKEEVNLGVFWFENDSLFPVMENNTELLNSRVVSINVGEDISGLSNYINMTFRFQNASLLSEGD
ncbi:uncharacterized protein [Salmo salar]|uniref:Uncharacterized protein n=1 Tax=Salmo salar TaxID=8030 RepID=A0ABM3CIC0_SALSA|nr:uncharacterized protein LOC106562072 [Salmo salar]